ARDIGQEAARVETGKAVCWGRLERTRTRTPRLAHHANEPDSVQSCATDRIQPAPVRLWGREDNRNALSVYRPYGPPRPLTTLSGGCSPLRGAVRRAGLRDGRRHCGPRGPQCRLGGRRRCLEIDAIAIELCSRCARPASHTGPAEAVARVPGQGEKCTA